MTYSHVCRRWLRWVHRLRRTSATFSASSSWCWWRHTGCRCTRHVLHALPIVHICSRSQRLRMSVSRYTTSVPRTISSDVHTHNLVDVLLKPKSSHGIKTPGKLRSIMRSISSTDDSITKLDISTRTTSTVIVHVLCLTQLRTRRTKWVTGNLTARATIMNQRATMFCGASRCSSDISCGRGYVDRGPGATNRRRIHGL